MLLKTGKRASVSKPRTNVANSRCGHTRNILTSMYSALVVKLFALAVKLFALGVKLFALAVKLYLPWQ